MNPDGEQKNHLIWKTIKEWTKTIIIALIIAIPIRYFIAEPFIVSGSSMFPTFADKQFLIVDRLTYRLDHPSRGDVVIFKYPNDPSYYYIKRIIGLPGETLSIKDGVVKINGKTLYEPYISSEHASHDSLSDFKLDTDQYFVMGDNRLESYDSRTWGPIKTTHLIGRPFLRLLPVNRAALLPGQQKENI